MSGEKTEAPTPRRLRDAAREGDVLKSRELGVALTAGAGVGALVVFGGALVGGLAALLRQGLQFGPPDAAMIPGEELLGTALAVAAPLAGLFGAIAAAAIAGQALFGGIAFNPAQIAFKAKRLSPAAGLKRMFGAPALAELAKSCAKTLLVGGLGMFFLWGSIDAMMAAGRADPHSIAARLGAIFAPLAMALVGGLVIVALVDLPVQLLQRAKRLRMSRQDVRDEMKQSEGSPEAKQAMRARQRAAIRNAVGNAVAAAHVVITNPTHFAVALRYESGRDAAPVVVARGRGVTAEVIREIAAGAGKPRLSYPELARAIYFSARVGDAVRADLYVAVATVLAFVFDVDRALRTQPAVIVPPSLRFDENGRQVSA